MIFVKVEEVQRLPIDEESSFVKVHGKRFPGEKPKFRHRNWNLNERRNMVKKGPIRPFGQKRNDHVHDPRAWTLVVNKNRRHKRDNIYKTVSDSNMSGHDTKYTANKQASGNKTRVYGVSHKKNVCYGNQGMEREVCGEKPPLNQDQVKNVA